MLNAPSNLTLKVPSVLHMKMVGNRVVTVSSTAFAGERKPVMLFAVLEDPLESIHQSRDLGGTLCFMMGKKKKGICTPEIDFSFLQ